MTYAVEAADLEADRGGILSAWGDSLTDGTSDHYRWVYTENPFTPTCWVLRDAGRVVVAGAATVIPRQLHAAGGGRWRGGITADFVVAREHRTIGPALMLQRALLAGCRDGGQYDVLYGWPNEAAARVQLRAGFTSLGKATELRRMLRSAGTLKRRYSAGGRVAAPFVDTALRVAECVGAVRGGQQFRFAVTTTFDHRFDDFWLLAAPRLPITGVRSSHFLNWRFATCPDRAYTALVMEDAANGHIAGYVVWHVRERDALIADFVADGGDTGVLRLMSELLRRLRADVETVTLRYVGGPQLASVLRRLGFRASESGRHAVFFARPDLPGVEDLRDRRNWYLLEGDADV